MLLSNSPVKNVSERLNTFSQKSKISRLKFERKSDYRTFLNFIKNNTRELESIELPIEKKKPGLLLGAGLGLGLLLGFLGRGKGDEGRQTQEGDSTTQLNTLKSVLEKTALESKRRDKQDRDTSRKLSDPKNPINSIKAYEFNRRTKKIQLENQRKNKIKKLELENRKLVRSIEERRRKQAAAETEELLKSKRKVKKKLQVNDLVTTGSGDGLAKTNLRTKSSKELVTLGSDFTGDDMQTRTSKKITKKSLATVGGQGSGVNFAQLGLGGESDGVGVTLGAGRGGTTGQGDADTFKRLTKPKPGEITKSQKLVQNFNKSRILEPTRISDQNFNNMKNLFAGNIGSDDLDNLIKIQRGFNEDGFQVVGNESMPDSVKAEIRRIQKRLSRKGLNNATRMRLQKRLNDIKTNSGFTKSTIDQTKFFQAPEIPKRKIKLNQFERFSNFSNRVLNSPFGKFTTFAGGLLANPKLEIIKQLLTPTPLADGTLEGKPINVNIFVPREGEESMIPFDPNIKAPLVNVPTDLDLPKNNVFVDVESNTSEDFFFIKMAGS